MKTILITGHIGYIGTVMTAYFLERGFQVIGLDTGYFEDCELFPPTIHLAEIKKDIRTVEPQDLEGVYAICHLAALSNDPIGEISPGLTEDINYEATLKLARTAKQVGVRKFIFSSSCSIYGIADMTALTEEAGMNPQTAYARSKVRAEKELLGMSTESFEVCSMRNGTAYGVSPLHRTDLVLNNLVGWAYLTGKIRIMSDGTPWRPIVHIKDICNAFWAAVTAPDGQVNGQAFNVGQNAENYQIRTMADNIKDLIPDTEIEYTYEHGSDSRTYNVNFDKIQKFLPDFKPVWNIRRGIQELKQAYEVNKLKREDFEGRAFVRLKQIKYLMENDKVDTQLYWNK